MYRNNSYYLCCPNCGEELTTVNETPDSLEHLECPSCESTFDMDDPEVETGCIEGSEYFGQE